MTESDDGQRVPDGRLGRLARLARVGAKAGASAVLRRDGDQAAKTAAEVLGNLRGIAAKVGQMAGYVDGVVPDEHRESYEKWMKGLLAQAPTSAPEEVRQVIEEELKRPLDAAFAEFDEVPIASASIGQVHRAVLEDGTPVAVKVQHPGIAKAVDADLKNAGLLEGTLAVMGTRKFESKRILAEVRQRFREELDYRLEAARQTEFAELHAGDPTIVVPKVYADHSAERVLTSQFVTGRSFDDAVGASEEERAAWVRTMWRFVFKGTLVGGMFNADPHPGNFIFGPDGTVYFLDFGCIQPLEPDRMRHARRMHWSAIQEDSNEFIAAVRDLMDLRGGHYEEQALGYVSKAFAPLFESPFHMSRDYVVGLVQGMKEIAVAARKAKGSDNFVPMPRGMFFMNRLQFGFYSVVARMDVPVDYRKVELEFLAPLMA